MRQYESSRNKLIAIVCVLSAVLLGLLLLVLTMSSENGSRPTVAPPAADKASQVTATRPPVETPADNVAAPPVAEPENSSSGPTGDAEYELFKGLGSPQAPKNAPKRPGDPIPPPTKPVTTPGSPATGQGGTSSAQSKTGTETTPGPKPAPGMLLPGDEGYR